MRLVAVRLPQGSQLGDERVGSEKEGPILAIEGHPKAAEVRERELVQLLL